MSSTFTSREFNRDPGSVKRAALSGPVFITDRDRPSLVVLAMRDYERLTGGGRSLLDVLMPGASPAGKVYTASGLAEPLHRGGSYSA